MKQLKVITLTLLLGVFAYFSYKTLSTELVSTDLSHNISQVRTINSALLHYYAGYSQRYPENLQQLVDVDILEQDHLDLGRLSSYYIKGYDAGDGDHIILFTCTYHPEEEYDGNQGIVAYVDGSVERIKRHELDNLLAQEIVKLRAQLSANRL